MNRKVILKTLGAIMCIEGVAMIPSALISAYCGEADVTSFLISIALCLVFGIPLSRLRLPPGNKMQLRDGYISVALCWIFLSLCGALPYIFSDALPSFADALFESVSGFTTTGASVMTTIEDKSRGILFWRSCTQWIGGMGILVMTLALLPKLGAGSVYLMRAESPGPIKSKLVPKIGQSAKILYLIYIILTAVEVVALKVAGMPLYDSICHALATMSSGGFSTMNSSVASYNSDLISWIITVFMFLAGVNFSIFFALAIHDFKSVRENAELKAYTALTIFPIIFITASRLFSEGGSIVTIFNEAAFQVVSVLTSTGFATADFSVWPTVCQALILLLMLIGGSAGSTAGGIKVIRALLLLKVFKREVKKLIHPRVVDSICINGHLVQESVLNSATLYFFIYIFVIGIVTIIVSLDNTSFAVSFSAALTTISNIGPGLFELGPAGNFASLSVFSKLTLCASMLFGRLELLPMLVLITYPFARKK